MTKSNIMAHQIDGGMEARINMLAKSYQKRFEEHGKGILSSHEHKLTDNSVITIGFVILDESIPFDELDLDEHKKLFHTAVGIDVPNFLGGARSSDDLKELLSGDNPESVLETMKFNIPNSLLHAYSHVYVSELLEGHYDKGEGTSGLTHKDVIHKMSMSSSSADDNRVFVVGVFVDMTDEGKNEFKEVLIRLAS